jgi:hypothetical protein
MVRIIFTFVFLLCCIGQQTEAQNDNGLRMMVDARSNDINGAENPCITDAQYQIIENNISNNRRRFHITSRNILQTGLGWPLKAADALTDCSYYYISAHVDQIAASGTFGDYNCGTLTYDGHNGTDIAIGPFGFYKMDNNQVEVIAAAPGTIVDKHDGEYDRNCVGAGSGLVANYIIVQHADGSLALYWHMKKNSVTLKSIGQTVIAGELLGIVGSSGSSSGPHLHFEVWNGMTAATRIDPFGGTCNLINPTSWWTVQKPYKEKAILKASVHTTDVVLPGCPTTEVPNESTDYTIPFQGSGLPANYAKFYIFMRNVGIGTTATMTILNPNGTVFNSWNYSFTGSFTSSYYGFSKPLPTNPGIYTFQADYDGNTCSQNFTINNPLGVTDNQNITAQMTLFPNPATTSVHLSLSQPIIDGTLHVFNQLGQKVKTLDHVSGQEITIFRDNLCAGIYFLKLATDDKTILSGKIIFADL